MKLSLPKKSLAAYVSSQMNSFFPDTQPVDNVVLLRNIDKVMERVEYCFSFVNNRYFYDGKDVTFNHLHADQYAMFLYLLSRVFYQETENTAICKKIFYLNKCLHCIDVFYEVDLPDIFLFVHPMGTVLGRGNYSNYLLVYQRCGIGSNKDIYPSLGEYVSLHPGSSILGNCTIGKNCKIAAGSLQIDRSLEDNSVYIGTPENYSIKKSRKRLDIWKRKQLVMAELKRIAEIILRRV